MLSRLLFAIFVWIGACVALAQGQSVQQSGNVTPGHVPAWTTNGVIQDGGTAANNSVTSLGATGQGSIICANSAAVTQPRYQFCLDPSDGQLIYQPLGGATPNQLSFVVNGITYPFPFTSSGILGPGSSVIGNCVLWNNTSGTLVSDCGYAPGGKTNGSNNNILTSNGSGFFGTPIVPGTNQSTFLASSLTVNGALKLNGSGTPSQAACADLTNGASGCSTTVGTMATQNANNVAITGGSISGVAVSITGSSVNSQTGDYTILTTDCGKTIQLSNGQHTLTLPGAGGFTAPCDISYCNADSLAGKHTVGIPSPYPGNLQWLWPGQCGQVGLDAGAWKVKINPGLWSANVTFYVDNGGSDLNDGLTSSPSRAFQTIQHCVNAAQTQVLVPNGNSQLTVCSPTAGQTFNECVSILGPFPGTNGVAIIGNGGKYNHSCGTPGASAIEVGDFTGLLLDNVNCGNGSTGFCIFGHQYGVVDIGQPGVCAGITFSSVSVDMIFWDAQGRVNVNCPITISGTASSFIDMRQGGTVNIGTVVITSSTAVPNTFYTGIGNVSIASNATYSPAAGNSLYASARPYAIAAVTNIINSGGTIPGAQAGSVSPGSYYCTTATCPPTPAVPAKTFYSVAAQSGITSTAAFLMGGYGVTNSFTPTLTGNVILDFSSAVGNGSTGDGCFFQLAYGVGSAPANGAAAAGTLVSSQAPNEAISGSTAVVFPVALNGYLAGLTIGTGYWFDWQIKAITGGTCFLGTATVRAIETSQ